MKSCLRNEVTISEGGGFSHPARLWSRSGLKAKTRSKVETLLPVSSYATLIYNSVASSEISAFSTRDTGQPTSALCASSSNFALSRFGTFAFVVR